MLFFVLPILSMHILWVPVVCTLCVAEEWQQAPCRVSPNWHGVLCFLLSRAKYAVSAIKKKVNDKNPHVALYALEVNLSQYELLSISYLPGFSGKLSFLMPAKQAASTLFLRDGGADLMLLLFFGCKALEGWSGIMHALVCFPCRCWNLWWRTADRPSMMKWLTNWPWRNWRNCWR